MYDVILEESKPKFIVDISSGRRNTEIFLSVPGNILLSSDIIAGLLCTSELNQS